MRRRLPDDAVLARTRVIVTRDAAGPVVHVQVGREVRSLRDADCRALVRAAVVVTVAIALSEARPKRADRRELPSEPPSALERQRPSESAPEMAREAPRAPPRLPALSAGLGSGVGLGLLPRPVFALELEARAEWSLFGAALDLRYLARGTATDARSRGVTVSALGAALAGFVRPEESLELRAGAVLYRLAGTGLGSFDEQNDTTWAAGPMAGFAWTPLRRSGFRVGVGAEAHLDLIRPEFEILNYGRVYAVPRFGGTAFFRIARAFF